MTHLIRRFQKSRFWAKLRAGAGAIILALVIGYADALAAEDILPVLGGAFAIGFGLIFWAVYDQREALMAMKDEED